MNAIAVFDKVTNTVITELPVHEPSSIAAITLRAREAQAGWKDISISGRSKLLKKARREFLKDKDKIKAVLARETGKVPFDVVGEMFSVCQQVSLFARHSKKWLRPRKVSTFPLLGKKGLIFYKPVGVVGVISPWNAPLTLAFSDILPALFAGNAVIVKPSEITPLAIQYAVDAFNRALPPGVLQCVIGEAATGEALVDNVDMVAVTGSCQTGRRVMERASRKLTPVLLELGGKDPMIVLKDADIERAANAAAWGACFMTGQVCMSVERIYVERAIASTFKESLRQKISALRSGPGFSDANADFGPFIGPKQITIVENQIADAKKKGAIVECGGERTESKSGAIYFQPTLISNVDHEMDIMKEETFGPVACVMEVDDADEAIALANDSEYGLNASVWTSDIDNGIALAQRISAGNVCVNDAILNAGVQSLPFGGIKQSGVGSRHGGEHGLHAFCFAQSLMVEPRRKVRETNWFPYEINVATKMEKMMMFIFRFF